MNKRRVVLVGLLLAAVFATNAQAQETAPTAEALATIATQDVGALMFTSDGQYLVVVDGVQVQLYTVTDPADPQDVAAVTLDEEPAALAVTADFALVAVGSEALVIAADPFNRGGFGVVNSLAAPDDTRQIAVSPDFLWGLIYGDGDYLLMRMDAATNIEQSPVFSLDNGQVRAAALSNRAALLLREPGTTIERVTLTTSYLTGRAPVVFALEAPASALAISPDGSEGVAALEDNRLLRFDPDDFTITDTIRLEDGPVTAIHWLRSGDRAVLALHMADREAVMLIDPTGGLPGSAAVDGRVRAIATQGDLLAVSTGDTITLFRFNG